ncbi:YoaK family protein [Microbacterium sp. ZW T5_45]|uniref:YoaK family protein n=1 Tax=Microbacterium sp. ZW T5_45 TaxID=3378080 RepID=UPI0038541E61
MSLAHASSLRRYPLLETVWASASLAFVSGLLDAWTFGQVGTFATVQSGNLISLGYFTAEGNVERALLAASSVLVFALGAFACSILILWLSRRGRSYSAAVLLVEILLLGALAALSAFREIEPMWIAWAISFLAGVQGNAFHRETGMLYGNIAVTSVIQMAAGLLGRAAGRHIADDGERHLRPAGAYLAVLAAFAAGGGAGFALDSRWEGVSLVLAAAILVALRVCALRGRGTIDPAGNGPTP